MSKVFMGLLILAVALSATAADELLIAREALRDGLWEIARAHASSVGESDEAKLVVLESFAGENRWEDVARMLKEWSGVKGDGFDYYRAVVKGDHAAAQAVLKRGGSSEGCEEARLHEADALAKAGKRAEAEAVWREIASLTNVSERAFALSSVNLMDAALLRRAYASVGSATLRRTVGLRLGLSLMRDAATAADGERLVRLIVKDSPDADGAREAFLAVADAKLVGGLWKDALDTFREAIEIWPDAAKLAAVQEGCGWSLQRLGRRDEALDAFRRAEELAVDDAGRATAISKQGDVLSELGRDKEAAERYRKVMESYPKTMVAEKLKAVIRLREQESEGRRLYRDCKFGEAMKVFEQVAEADSARRQRMGFFIVLCLYGQGREDEAMARARKLVAECPDAEVRSDATIWLAKLQYNRREWKEAGRLFAAYAESPASDDSAAEALLWASRAALANREFESAIQLSTRLVDRYPNEKRKAAALLVQGEALVELARLDEAILVFDRAIIAEGGSEADRFHARVKKADALYAMGADNATRYAEALEAYRSIRTGNELTSSGRVSVSFKIARTLEKLKRIDEAMDQYYSRVIIAYRDGRLQHDYFDDDARACFSRAAFRLADEYESRGREMQAVGVLQLLAESDVPAAEEARKRIDRISSKGRFL